MSELEIKFRVDTQAAARVRIALLERGAAPVRMRAYYFDTHDGRVAAAGLSWRLRQEGTRWVQTVKAAGSSEIHRLEHEVEVVRAAGARRPPDPDPTLHAGDAAGDRLIAALRDSTRADWVEVQSSDIERLRVILRSDGGTQVEAALDIGQVKAHSLAAPIAELELEHVGGPVAGLFEIALEWLGDGMWFGTLTKAARAGRLGASAPPPAVKARAPLIDAESDGPSLVRASLRSALDQTFANGSEIGEGSTDPEHLHQLRIGLRRLRVVLREFAGLAPGIDPGWDTQLRASFARLGERRDQETVSDALEPLLAEAGAPVTRWAPTHQVDVAATWRHRALQATLIRVLGLAYADDASFAPLGPAESRAWLRQRLQRLHRRVVRDGAGFENLDRVAQHRVRKRLKRLRYLAEFVAPLWPERAVERYLDRVEAAQDALGIHHDGVVGIQTFREAAVIEPRCWFAVGFLEARTAATARRARKALEPLDDVARFWKGQLR